MLELDLPEAFRLDVRVDELWLAVEEVRFLEHAGAAQIGETLVDDWLQTNARGFITREPAQDGELSQFGLGEALLRVYSLLDGRTRLGDLAARVRSPEARTNLLRLTYLLVQTELARLS